MLENKIKKNLFSLVCKHLKVKDNSVQGLDKKVSKFWSVSISKLIQIWFKPKGKFDFMLSQYKE